MIGMKTEIEVQKHIDAAEMWLVHPWTMMQGGSLQERPVSSLYAYDAVVTLPDTMTSFDSICEWMQGENLHQLSKG